MTFSIVSACPNSDKKFVEVKWDDGHNSRFHAKWLRFYCRCKRCQPELKGTYLVDIPAFPEEVTIAKVDVDEKGINVKINEELVPDHVIWHDSQWLRERCPCDVCHEDVTQQRDVISKNGLAVGCKTLPTMEYQELLDDLDQSVYRWLKHVMTEGYCLIKNLPTEPWKVCELAEMVGPARQTCYGRTLSINLGGKEHGTNHTGVVPFHQDNESYEIPNGLILLHCRKFDKSIIGGKSKITDLFLAAELLRRESPEDFKTFTEVPGSWDTVNYHLKYPAHHENQKCHIVVDYFGKIVGVNWGPQLASPVRLREKDFERYFKAHRKFSEIINRKENQITHRLEPGDVLTMNNRRCAHARESLETVEGERELSVAYVIIEDAKSRYMYLGDKLGYSPVPPKVGNMSSF